MFRRIGIGLGTVALFVLVGCGDDATPEGTSSEPTVDTTIGTVTTSTTEAPATTVAETTSSTTATTEGPATTAPPTTTAPLTAESFVLRPNGLGPFDFGVPAAAVFDSLSTIFGTPSFDQFTLFPNDMGDGSYQTVEGESVLDFPFGRLTCFGERICVEFGGAESASTEFIAWSFMGGIPGIASAEGVTVGNRWADVAAHVNFTAGGCYTVGWGTLGDITVVGESSGVWFTVYDEATGTYVNSVPAPEDVTITMMLAGKGMGNLFEDC